MLPYFHILKNGVINELLNTFFFLQCIATLGWRSPEKDIYDEKVVYVSI